LLSPFVVFGKAKALSQGNRLFFPHQYFFPERNLYAWFFTENQIGFSKEKQGQVHDFY
jgi:hypothetical protein